MCSMKNLRISLGRRADATQAEAAICEGFATWSCLESDVQSFPGESTIIRDMMWDMIWLIWCVYMYVYIYIYICIIYIYIYYYIYYIILYYIILYYIRYLYIILYYIRYLYIILYYIIYICITYITNYTWKCDSPSVWNSHGFFSTAMEKF